MPTRKSAIKAIMDAHAVSRPLATAALQAIWPIQQKAFLGRYEIASVRIDPKATAKAIAAAIGKTVHNVAIDVTKNARAFISGRHDIEYTAGLGFLIGQHRTSLNAMLAAEYGEKWPAFRDGLWDALRIDIASRLDLTFWDDPNTVPARATVGDNLVTALYHFLAAAAVGDVDGSESLGGLIRILPSVVPIGERPRDSGEWLLVMPPVAK